MPEPIWNQNRRVRVMRLPTWQLALLLVVALAIGVAVAVVATGVFLIVLPIAAVVAIAYRLFGGRKRRTVRGDAVIEGEYEVVSAGARRGRHRNDAR